MRRLRTLTLSLTLACLPLLWSPDLLAGDGTPQKSGIRALVGGVLGGLLFPHENRTAHAVVGADHDTPPHYAMRKMEENNKALRQRQARATMLYTPRHYMAVPIPGPIYIIPEPPPPAYCCTSSPPVYYVAP
ncbi:MAG: hypothetical protein HQL53_04105 [Magnetococcales bacterium]|nr:hypothetical protein [Magnetococcales bacterium]